MENMLIKFPDVMKLRDITRMEAGIKFEMILTNWTNGLKIG